MTAERASMTLNEVSVPALGAEERSDDAPRAGRARPTPDPEVVAKPKRRQFTAEYRLRILEEADRCTQPGEVGRLLHRPSGFQRISACARRSDGRGPLRPAGRGAGTARAELLEVPAELIPHRSGPGAGRRHSDRGHGGGHALRGLPAVATRFAGSTESPLSSATSSFSK